MPIMKLKNLQIMNINNKIKLFFYFSKNSFLSLQIYNEAVLISLLRNFILFIMQIALWLAVQKNENSDFSIHYITNYFFISQMITVMYPSATSGRIAYLIESGDISMKLLRPVNVFTELFFYNLGRSIYFFLVNFLPLFAVYIFIFAKLPYFDLSLLSAIYLLYSYVLCFLFECIFGCLSFFTYSFWGTQSLKYALVSLLTGKFVPIRFYPQFFLKIIDNLPFKYMYAFPIDNMLSAEVFTITNFELLKMAVYFFVVIFILSFLYKKGKQLINIQGG